MKLNQKGAFDEGIMILLGLSIVLFVFILPAKKLGPTPGFTAFKGFSGTNTSTHRGGNTSNNPSYTSSYADDIRLGTGSASYASDPSTEYITIVNQGESPINITGWKLQNAKGERTYVVGSSEQHFQSDQVTIPTATLILSPLGNNIPDAVVLKKGEEAVVTTGPMGVAAPYKIVSFKENMCTGYLENLSTYDFTPPLRTDCPDLEDEAGFKNLDRECQSVIRTFSDCHTPVLGGLDRDGRNCVGCVNGREGLSSSCIAFISSHASYPTCLAKHKQDTNFEGKTWHVFLNQKWELWDRDNETISLFDQTGNLVTSYTY